LESEAVEEEETPVSKKTNTEKGSC